jgi:putative redox protein
MTKTRVKWIEGVTFMGLDANGRGTLMSGMEGPGVRPMQMLLLALGGCSSIDVLSILQKQRLNISNLEVELDGERAEEEPRPFKKIHIHFIVSGQQIDPKKVERAIKLSTEKYCGVYVSLSGVADITWGYEIRETENTLPTTTGTI